MNLYTKTVCPQCMRVKAELVRAGLTVDVINIDQDVEGTERIKAAGYATVPILEVDGIRITETD